jgi:hypothetical protein
MQETACGANIGKTLETQRNAPKVKEVGGESQTNRT